MSPWVRAFSRCQLPRPAQRLAVSTVRRPENAGAEDRLNEHSGYVALLLPGKWDKNLLEIRIFF